EEDFRAALFISLRRFQPSRFDDLGPLFDLAANVGAELLGARPDRLQVGCGETLLHVLAVQSFERLRVQARDDLGRRLRRHQKTVPASGFVSLYTRLGDRRDVRRYMRALGRGYAEAAQSSRPYVRIRRAGAWKTDRGFAAHQRGQGVGRAPVGDVRELGLRHALKELR